MREVEKMPNIRVLLKGQESYVTWLKLGQNQLLRKITRPSLNPAILPNLRWAVIKNNKCVFVFNHPAAAVEFGKTKEAIKARMREEYKAHKEQCKLLGIVFDDIVCEYLLQAPQEQETLTIENSKSQEPQPSDYYQRSYRRRYYKEQSSGEFNIPQNCSLKKKFMEIQNIIKENLAKERIHNEKSK